ncbi:MAG: FecR domain-containing protein [Paludibacteraceae bacterium]|nr:FecR domain-containing protein [Paludibacteraceae bacterium]
MEDEILDMDFQELIVRYLAGDADKKEQLLLLQWLKESPSHIQTFNSIRKVSDACRQMSLQEDDFHLSKAVAAFDKKVQTKIPNIPLHTTQRRSLKRVVWAITSVAAVALFVVVFSLTKTKSGTQNVVLAQATDKGCQVVLSDGTKAVLSKNTRIFAAKSFDKEHRVLSLQGEAFFHVKHDKVHPFVIKANDVTITDIGTAFNVNTDSVTKNSYIFVKEGVVKVDYYGQVSVLHAGEYAKTDVKKKKLVEGKTSATSRLTSNDDMLVFENTPMNVVVAKLNERYKTNFVLASSSLKNCKLNASFDNNTNVEQIKELLSIVLNVDIKDAGGKLLIYTHSD